MVMFHDESINQVKNPVTGMSVILVVQVPCWMDVNSFSGC